MCGIAGFTAFHRSFGDEDTAKNILRSMGESIAHRGPDAHDEYYDGTIGFAHRRLAIVDLSPAGVQPMHIGRAADSGANQSLAKCTSKDAKLSIVFNGEIYNFLDLKASLQEQGVLFKSESDTEVILHLYDRYGVGCLEYLNGMFAFAIYDHEKQGVFFARDRLGKKPLYYHLTTDGDISFASEIKALRTIPNLTFSLNHKSVYDFFTYQYIPDPYSIFNEVRKLPPASYCWLDAKGYNIHSYWDLSFTGQPANETESQAASRLQKEINRATRQRMISDVPLGAFLSGGIDSGGIVATMVTQSKQQAVKRSYSKKVKTCSIGFENAEFNELALAKKVAQHYDTEHHELILKDSLVDDLERICTFFDEPFADQSLLPTYHVSRIARQEVTVALTGDGGDEGFAGYAKYAADAREHHIRKFAPQFVWQTVSASLKIARKLFPFRKLARAANFAESLAAGPALGFFISNRFMSDHEWNRLAKNTLKKKLDSYHPSHYSVKAYHKSDSPDHLGKVLYTDVKTFLPGDILVKADRMSMANSLELRAPLLDYKVLEQAAFTRSDLKIRDGKLKYILKQLFSKMLPSEILTAKKRGFDIPLAEWLRQDLKQLWETKVLAEDASIYKFFSRNAVLFYWQAHQNAKQDHSSILWSMLMFELWFQHYGHWLASNESNSASENAMKEALSAVA